MLLSGLLSHQLKFQNIIVLFSIKTKYITIYKVRKKVLYISRFLVALGF